MRQNLIYSRLFRFSPGSMLAMAALAVCVLALSAPAAQAQDFDSDDPFADNIFGAAAGRTAWDAETMRAQVETWLDAVEATAGQREQIATLLESETINSPDGADKLTLLAGIIEVVDPDAQEVVELCRQNNPHIVPPGFAFLQNEDIPSLVRDNIRLLYGRWLCQERFFDESLAQLEGLDPADVVDPGSLLFYKSVAYHRLSMKEQGLEALGKLINEIGDRPRRYDKLAEIMHQDLTALEGGSLDEISRWMDDVERRLELGRTGTKVRGIEDQIVKGLDKIIEELEKQQGGGGGAGGIQSSSPAGDSQIAGGQAPGEVTQAEIGSKQGWGALPPKEREEAMQQVGKDLPERYRNHIERYFRRLADKSID